MDALRHWLLSGLGFPAIMIAMGAGLILFAPFKRRWSEGATTGMHPVVRYLLTRSAAWDRRAGWFIILGNLFIVAVRLWWRWKH